MEAILEIMNTTEVVEKIRPEKYSGPHGPKFFQRCDYASTWWNSYHQILSVPQATDADKRTWSETVQCCKYKHPDARVRNMVAREEKKAPKFPEGIETKTFGFGAPMLCH